MRNNSVNNWLTSAHGQQFLALEKEATDRAMRSLAGPNVLLVGNGLQQEKLLELDFPFLIKVDSEELDQSDVLRIVADEAFLPFVEDSFASVLLPHVLEGHELPHQVLREAHRVLQPEGHLLLTCCNPYSFMGLQRLIGMRVVPQGRYYSLSRVKDWLHLLGFEVVASAMYHYAPLFRDRKFQNRKFQKGQLQNRRHHLFNAVGDRWLPMLGGSYVITARKRDIGVNLVGKLPQRRQSNAAKLAPASVRRVESNYQK